MSQQQSGKKKLLQHKSKKSLRNDITILDNLIDNRLLEIKAKELGIQQINDPDEKKLNGLQGELQQRKFLLKAILMKTLDDNTLKKFYEEQKGELESLLYIKMKKTTPS